MTADEMENLRSEVYANLNEARNELWFILELAKTLAAGANITADPPPEPIPSAPTAKKGKQQQTKGVSVAASAAGSVPPPSTAAEAEAPILPAGTFSTTPSAAPARSDVETAVGLELALAARQQALDDCAALIDAAVDELQLMNKASEHWSTDVRDLRLGDEGKGQWAVVPKPDFARTGTDAKDVVIPYALDEAPPGLHSRSLAAFDLDPRKADTLAFGSRSFHRLRVLYRMGGSGGVHCASTAYRADDESERGVRATIEAAQLETIDEDLFNELRVEAARMDSLIEPQSIGLLVGRNKLTFQMYDTRETPSPNAEVSPLCDAVLSFARMGLLHTYQRRKQRLVEPQPPSAPTAGQNQPAPAQQSQQPTILLPIIHLFQFHAAIRGVRPSLSNIEDILVGAGLNAALVERHSAEGNSDAVYGLLAGRAKVDVLGAVFSLEVAGCAGITINVTAPSTINVSTPRATFPLRDLDAVSGIVTDALSSQLSRFAYDTVLASADEAAGIFFDELDGIVIAGSLGALDISLPAPYTHLRASVDSDVIAPYDSRDAGHSFVDWLGDLARAVPAIDGEA